jgi:hypothetical protein
MVKKKINFFTPEMDSRAKTKYKTIKRYFFSVKNKKVLFLFFWGKPSNTMYPISDYVHIFFGDPSQQWAAYIKMNFFLVKIEKKNFSPE